MDRRALRKKKNKSRNAKPYDRPNQGILGKVASKVKDLFTPSSWNLNVLQWMSIPQEQPGSSNDPDEESADEDEVSPQATTISSTTYGSKRPRLRLYEPAPSILSEGTQTFLDAPSSSNLFNQSPHLPSTVTQNTLVENKESPIIMNGDDHSENSEGSASTSGCSSLISSHKERSNCLGPSNLRLSETALANLRGTLKNTIDLKNRRDLASRKEEFSSPNTSASRLSLWSPVTKFHQRSPSVANSSQPGFNVSAFVAPSKVNQQMERKVASPFYQGKTSFGGASSARKMPVSTAPYQTERPPRNQIRVRSNQSEDSLEGMSSAAKRILLTLEKMSSPVIDAKKIPNTNKSPVDLSLYMMPPKHRSNVMSTPVGSSKGPPIANISTISKLTTLKNFGIRKFQNSAMESLPPPSEEKIKIPTDIFQSELLQPPPAKGGGGGGKMKSKIHQQHQPSAGNNTLEELECVSLPNVPLPISTLPTFSFGPKPEKSSEFINKMGNDFVFSSPIEVLPKVPVYNNLAVSNPVGSWECDTCLVRNTSDKQKCVACETARPSKTNISGLKDTENFKFSSPITFKFNSTPSKPETTTTASSTFTFGSSNFSGGTFFTPASSTATFGGTVIPSASSTVTFGGTVIPSASSTATPVNGKNELKATLLTETSTPKPVPEFKFDAPKVPLLDTAKSDTPIVDLLDKKENTDAKSFTIPERKSGSEGSSLPSMTNSSSSAFKMTPSATKNTVTGPLTSSASTENKKSFLPVPEKTDFTKINSQSLDSKTTENAKKISVSNSATDVPLSKMFTVSNPVGSWECDTCLVRNTPDKQKCVACETLRPSKTNMSGLKDPESFKFSSPLQGSPITFKFNSPSKLQTTIATTATSTFAFDSSNSSTSTFLTPVSSTATFGGAFLTPVSSSATSVNGKKEPKSVSLNETSTPKSVPEFKFDAPKVPLQDISKPDLPSIETVDKKKNTDAKSFTMPESKNSIEGSSLPSITSSGNSAFKMTSPVSKNTLTGPLTSSATTEKDKMFLSVPEKTNTTKVDSQSSDSKKNEVFPSVESKGTPFGGFNFKIPSSATSAFGGFGATSSNTDSKFTSQVKNTAIEKKPDPNLSVTVSTPSLTSAFSTPISTPGFKTENAKTSEVSAVKNIFASSVTSTSSTTTPTFNFSYAPISTGTSGLAPAASQPSVTQAFSNMAKGQDKKTVTSVASFSAATTASTFTFGTPTTTTTQSNPSSGFSFFTSSAANATPSTTPSLFSFGNSNASQASTTGGFTFKGLNADKHIPAPSNTFNTPKTTSSEPSLFKFNAASAHTSSPSGFVFGAVKSEPGTASAPTATFSFGSGSAQSTNSTFSGFQTNPSATPFQFGTQPAANTVAAPSFGSGTNTFTFGKTESVNPLPTTQASTGFGNSVQPMFGGAAAPAFGKTEKPAFNFGMPQGSNTPVFQFGEKKQQTTGPQFSFGTPAQETTAPPVPSFNTQFNFNATPNFNFGASSTQPGPFQFAASTDSQSSAPRKIRKAVRRGPRKD